MIRWAGSVAVVTGASRGIGRAVARAAHARGARVGLIARSADELEALARELGARAAFAAADVGDRAAVDAAVEALTAQLGPVDILVNNAGIGAYGAFSEEAPETIERLMRVNYLGTVYPTKAVLPGMMERRRGHIVNVASIAGLIGAPFESAYSASKFAVVGLTEGLDVELSAFGIGVSLVNPGPVATSFFDARGVPYQRARPRPIAADEIAGAVMRAVEQDRYQQVLPRWIGWVRVLSDVFSSGVRKGKRNEFRAELAEYARTATGRSG